MRSTINDVAKMAGVSSMSVSLAFKGSTKISRATRERIFEIAERLNYVPNQAARQLRTGKTDIVGFIVTDLANPFHSMMMKQAENAFHEMGLTLFTGGSNWQAERETAFAERLIRMQARGVLICPCEKNFAAFELLDKAGIPYVALDSVPDSYAGPYVVNDLEQCGRLVAEHFHQIGSRKPAYVDAAPDMLYFSAFQRTRKAFFRGLEDFRLTVGNRYVSAGMTLEAGAEAFRRMAVRGFEPDAVFCVNDLCALGFMDEAGRHGLRAGRDFALAGIDDMEISALSALSLTSVRQPYRDIAQKSVQLLCSLMDGKTPEKSRLMLPQELCVRETTRGCARRNETAHSFY